MNVYRDDSDAKIEKAIEMLSELSIEQLEIIFKKMKVGGQSSTCHKCGMLSSITARFTNSKSRCGIECSKLKPAPTQKPSGPKRDHG